MRQGSVQEDPFLEYQNGKDTILLQRLVGASGAIEKYGKQIVARGPTQSAEVYDIKTLSLAVSFDSSFSQASMET